MKSLGLNRYALAIGAAAAFGGCGGSQPPIGAPNLFSKSAQSSRIVKPSLMTPIGLQAWKPLLAIDRDE